MVNVPPLLCSTPPPMDFGEEDDDSGLQSTLNLDDADEFADYGLVTAVQEAQEEGNAKSPTPQLALPTTDYAALPPDIDNCYMSRILPPPLSETSDVLPMNLKPIEAFNFDVAFESQDYISNELETQDFGNFQGGDNEPPPISKEQLETNENGVAMLGDDEDEEEETTNNDNVPSLKLDSLSLYSSESVSSATISPAIPLDEPENATPDVLASKSKAKLCEIIQVTLEDVSDDSSDEYSPKKRKSLIVSEGSEDFFAIHIVNGVNETTKEADVPKLITEVQIEPKSNDCKQNPPKCVDSLTNNDFADFQTSVQQISINANNNVSTAINAENFVDDDDFGDFADFTASAVETPVTSVQQINTASTQESSAVDSDDFDDFQDFSAANEINESSSKDEIVPTDSPTVDDDDDDDFGDFSEASFAPVNSNLVVEEVKTVTAVPPPPPPALTNVSIQERVKPVLEMMFPSTETCKKDEKLSLNLKQVLNFVAIEQAKALDYQWSNSEMRHALIRSLGIDSRNILFGEKWNSTMPRFAANLSFDPLKPMKSQTNTTTSTTTNALPTYTSDIDASVTATTISADDFDWKSNSTGGGSTIANVSLGDSHVQTLQLEQLDQLMMVANADKINLDSSNYSYSSSTCVSTTTTTLTPTITPSTTTTMDVITSTPKQSLINSTKLQNDFNINTTTTTTTNEMSSNAKTQQIFLPLDVFGDYDDDDDDDNHDDDGGDGDDGDGDNVKIKSNARTNCTLKNITITNTNNNNNIHNNTFDVKKSQQTKCCTNNSENICSNDAPNSPLVDVADSIDSFANANNGHYVQQQQLLNIFPINNGNDADISYTKRAFVDCRIDTTNQPTTTPENKTTFHKTQFSESNATNAIGQESHDIVEQEIVPAASEEVFSNNDSTNAFNTDATVNTAATSSADIVAATTASISTAVSADSNGLNFDTFEQQPNDFREQLQQQQTITKAISTTATIAAAASAAAAITTPDSLRISNNDASFMHCDVLPALNATTYAVPLKETHIYTPSKSDTAVAKTTTTTPIDFDYEIASAGIIIDETVVKKEYRDVEYKPPYDLEMPNKLNNAFDVIPKVTNVSTSGTKYFDLPKHEAVDDADDDFSDFQSVPAEKMQTKNINSNLTTPSFGEQMILSPAILLPKSIPLAKPTIEWGESTAKCINPEELARIEELFPQPKISTKPQQTDTSLQASPVYRAQQALTISAAVAKSMHTNEDDDWSDFVSVPIVAQQQKSSNNNITNNNNNSNNNNKILRPPPPPPAATVLSENSMLPKNQVYKSPKKIKATSQQSMAKIVSKTTASTTTTTEDEWSDFVSSTPLPTAMPQFNSAAWQSANFYNNPLSFYQHNQQHAHSNIVPKPETLQKQQNQNLNNININNNNNNINSINYTQNNSNNIKRRQQQQQQQQQHNQPQQIHIMHDFSTAPPVELTMRTSHAASTYQQQQQQQQHQHQSGQFQIGNAKVAPRISLIPDLSFVAPVLPSNPGAFMNSLPKPSFSAKK